jgi:hypothetical protein
MALLYVVIKHFDRNLTEIGGLAEVGVDRVIKWFLGTKLPITVASRSEI